MQHCVVTFCLEIGMSHRLPFFISAAFHNNLCCFLIAHSSFLLKIMSQPSSHSCLIETWLELDNCGRIKACFASDKGSCPFAVEWILSPLGSCTEGSAPFLCHEACVGLLISNDDYSPPCRPLQYSSVYFLIFNLSGISSVIILD